MRIYDYIPNADIAGVINTLWARSLTRCHTGGTLAVKATSDPDFKTTTTINYSIGGTLYIKTSAATIDASGAGITSAGEVQAAGTYAAYLFTLTSAGAWDIIKGDDASTAALALAALPEIPASECAVGLAVIANTTNPFTLGTTNTDATGVTVTCYDIADVVNGSGSVYLDTNS